MISNRLHLSYLFVFFKRLLRYTQLPASCSYVLHFILDSSQKRHIYFNLSTDDRKCYQILKMLKNVLKQLFIPNIYCLWTILRNEGLHHCCKAVTAKTKTTDEYNDALLVTVSLVQLR